MVAPIANLILIKHSLPEIEPTLPAASWHLSAKGFDRVTRLAVQVSKYQPEVVVSSKEPKAVETGEKLAEILKLPVFSADGLHEHERSKTGYLDQKTFAILVENLFDNPDQLVFGDETANQALARFSEALTIAQAEHAGKNLAVVSHGTVISLFTARHCGLDPFQIWRSLELPSYIMLETPGYRLIDWAYSIKI